MRRLTHLVALTAAAVLLAGQPASSVPTPTEVVPGDLPAGDAPRIAYVEGDQLVRPGKRAVDLGGEGGDVLRVRGGYLVSIAHGEGRKARYEIDFVSDRGQRRLFVDLGRYAPWLNEAVVSADGRLVSAYGTAGKSTVDVRRVSDGRVIARRDAIAEGRDWERWTHPLAVDGRRVLLHQSWRDVGQVEEVRSGRGRLVWWHLDGRRDKVVVPWTAYRNQIRWENTAIAPAVDLSSRWLAVPSGIAQRVRPFPGAKEKAWRTGAGEIVAAWSPNDRHVLTASYPGSGFIGYNRGALVERLQVRAAKDGEVLATFVGRFRVAHDQAHHDPVWETSNSFVVRAYGDEVGANRELVPSLVRCRVSTQACELVDDTEPLASLVRRAG